MFKSIKEIFAESERRFETAPPKDRALYLGVCFVFWTVFITLAIIALFLPKSYASADTIDSYPLTNHNYTRYHTSRVNNISTIFFYTFDEDVNLQSLKIPLGRAANCSGNVWYEIRTGVTSGVTKGTLLARSNDVTCNSAIANSGTISNVDFLSTFPTFNFGGVDLEAGTQYAFILTGNNTPAYIEHHSPTSGFTPTTNFYVYNPASSLTYANGSPTCSPAQCGMAFQFTYQPSTGGVSTIVPIPINIDDMNATTTCTITSTTSNCTTAGYDYSNLIGIGILIMFLCTFIIIYIFDKKYD